jgi:threonine/homoserine/homoserine lactone efflux protein
MNSLNPGVIITWLSAVAAIATFNNNERFTFFSACLLLILGFDLLKVLLAQRIRKHLTPRTILYLNRISALCIVGMGVFLLIKTYLGIKIGGV